MPVDPIYQSIGALVKAKRNTLGMKQEELAKLLDISRGSLANIETGKQSVLVHQLYKFANALKLSPTDLLPSNPMERPEIRPTTLPIPANLKAIQKQQVERFFMLDPVSPRPVTKSQNVKITKQ